jgi:serine protease Do
MGVFVRTVSPEDAEYLDLSSIEGVKVDNFSIEDSPARRAGLQRGDVILSVDGTPIKYVAQLQQFVGFRTPGENVTVRIARADGIHEYRVRLMGASAGPADSAESAPATTPPAKPERNPELENRLGVDVVPMTDALARELQLTETPKGLLVRAVAPRSPAAMVFCPVEGCVNRGRGGVDIITEIEGKSVRTEADFEAALASGGRNGIVSLKVLRPQAESDTRIERLRLIKPD